MAHRTRVVNHAGPFLGVSIKMLIAGGLGGFFSETYPPCFLSQRFWESSTFSRSGCDDQKAVHMMKTRSSKTNQSHAENAQDFLRCSPTKLVCK